MKYTLNKGVIGSEIDIFLLDERYERDIIPCFNRREYCDLVLDPMRSVSSTERTAHSIAWCQEFLQGGEISGSGTCCTKDEEIFLGWCKLPSSKNSQYFRYACDVTFEHFAQLSLVLRDGELMEPDDEEPLDVYQSSPICEVLGKNQRRWLRETLESSTAPLKIVVSGSVLMANPLPYTCGSYIETNKSSSTFGQLINVQCTCSGDDIDCYPAAQQELFQLITNVSGCAVVLTGDYHFSDIKAMFPGTGAAQSDSTIDSSLDSAPENTTYPYVSLYGSQNNSQPLYQVMASGMSYSTAINYTCDSFRLDPMKLRTHPECSFVTGPNFGRILVDYVKPFMNRQDVGASSAHYLDKPSSEFEGHSSPVVGNIRGITLQVLSGLVNDKVLLSTDVDIGLCNPLKPH